MWKYFDSQHAFIMKRMKDVRTSAMANVQGNSNFPRPMARWRLLFEAVYDRTMPRISGPNDLTDRLASELRICVPVLESKQGETTIGDHDWLSAFSPHSPSMQLPVVTTNFGG